MAGYQHTLLLHLILAVIGVGPLVGLTIIAYKSPSSESTLAAFASLKRWNQSSLGLLFLTGVVLLWVTGWGYFSMIWLWVALALYFALFPLVAQTAGSIAAATKGDEKAAARVKLLSIVLFLDIVLIVYLMHARPL